MTKEVEKILCQGCLHPFSKSEIYLVYKTNHCFFACESCCKKEYKELPSMLYSISNKINKSKESYTKTGLTKDNKKVKIGDTYKKIEIKSIKKVVKTFDYDKKKKEILSEIKFYISNNRKDWIEI